MQPPGAPSATPPTTPPPALAYWLTAEAHTALRAVASATLHVAESPRLRAAVTELDAAAIRSRWFDHPAAASFRRIAGHRPDAVLLRLTEAERAALVACDPAVVTPLLEDDTHPSRPAPADDPRPSVTPPDSPAGPVLVLVPDNAGIARTWGVAEYDGITLHVTRPAPDADVWTRAREQTRIEPVIVDAAGPARRLVARAHPALSSLALTRAEFRPGPGDAVLLHEPETVVVAPADIAARAVLYAAPAEIVSLTADEVPTEPMPTARPRPPAP